MLGVMGAADAKPVGMTGCERKLASCGRKKASDSNEGRKIAIFPYPLYKHYTSHFNFLYAFIYTPLRPKG